MPSCQLESSRHPSRVASVQLYFPHYMNSQPDARSSEKLNNSPAMAVPYAEEIRVLGSELEVDIANNHIEDTGSAARDRIYTSQNDE